MAKKKNKAGMYRYLKEAFTFRWNLLFLGGATVAAALAAPDILLPLVAAGELAYLVGLSAVPKFQAAIDARVHAETGEIGQLISGRSKPKQEVSLSQTIRALDRESRQRFLELRKRCGTMHKISKGVRGHHREQGGGIGGDARTPGLERLLWVFLRLQVSDKALRSFLDATDEDEISEGLADLEERKKIAEEKGQARIVNSLNDSISTAMMRLENYQKAEGNAQFVEVELDQRRQAHKLQNSCLRICDH
ncbi:MAG: hypothetical protein GY811_15780 [Myxococcales bacterium]|nr:hypothetical protein [Myxococcales bacterium]